MSEKFINRSEKEGDLVGINVRNLMSSLNKTVWKSYVREKRILSSGRRCTKLYGHYLSTGFACRVLRRRSVISRTSLIRNGNPHESRSRIYRTSISSSIGVKLCWTLRFSAFRVRSFIRSRRVVWEMSYVFTTHRIDISGFVRIIWMTRRILASWDLEFIVLLCCDYVRQSKDRNVKEKCTGRLYVRVAYEPR